MRRTRAVVAGTAAITLLGGAWLVLGLTPRFADGGMAREDPEALTRHDTSYDQEWSTVVEPSDGTYHGLTTFENNGLLPATVRLAEPVVPPSLDWHAELLPVDPATFETRPARDAVVVGPGGTFAVEYALALGCGHFAAGTATGVSTVRLAVTTLGLTREVELPLASGIMVGTSTGHVPPEGCEP